MVLPIKHVTDAFVISSYFPSFISLWAIFTIKKSKSQKIIKKDITKEMGSQAGSDEEKREAEDSRKKKANAKEKEANAGSAK